MKFTLKNPVTVIEQAGKLVPTRTTFPILQNVLFDVVPNGVTLTATNLDATLKRTVEASADASFSFTLPYRLGKKSLADFLRLVPSDSDVTFEWNEKTATVRVTADDLASNIKGIDASEFPSVANINADASFSIESSVLTQAVKQAIHAAALDDARPVLHGVAFVLDKNLTLAATDGHRLAVVENVTSERKSKDKLVLIVPLASAEMLLQIASRYDNNVSVTTNGNMVSFDWGNTVFYTSLIKGNFPDYTQIVPKSHTTRLTVDREQLKRAVTAAEMFAPLHIVKFEQDGADMLVSAQDAETGNAQDRLAVSIEGEPFAPFAISGKYLIAWLGVCDADDETVIVEMNNSSSPFVFRDPSADNFTTVIMPIHIGN